MDRHAFDADPGPDPDSNFHFDADRDLDRHQYYADPLADPTPSFTMLWKIRIFLKTVIHVNACSQYFSFPFPY